MKYNTNNLTKAPKKSWFSFARICKILTCFFVITTFCMIFFRLTLLGQASDWAFHILLGYFKWFLYISVITIFFIYLITKIRISTLLLSLSIMLCSVVLLQICLNSTMITIAEQASKPNETLGQILLHSNTKQLIKFDNHAMLQNYNTFDVKSILNHAKSLIGQIKASNEPLMEQLKIATNWTGFVGYFVAGTLAIKTNFVAAMVIPYVTTFIVMFICICLMKFRSKPKFFKKPALNSKSALNSDQQKFLAQIKSNRELENKYAVDLKPPSFINKPDTIKNNFEYPVEVKLNQAEKNVKAKFEDRYIGPTGDIDKENFLNYLEPKQLVKPTSFINQEYKTVFEEHKMLEQDADFEATFAQHVTSDTYEKIKALIIEKRWSLITIMMLKTYFKLNNLQADLIIKKLKHEKIIVPN